MNDERREPAGTGRGMGGHQSHRSITCTWLTPPHILSALGRFDLDPCGFPGWASADRLICPPDDGLAAPWHGRVWCNPPYGRQTWAWLARLADHGCGTALVFARTEVDGFCEQVWRRADAILFLAGRLHFHRPDGSRATDNAGAPSALVAYGPGDAAVLAGCGLPGALVTGWRQIAGSEQAGRQGTAVAGHLSGSA